MEKKEGFLYTRKRRRNDEFSFGGNPGSHLAAAGHVCGGYCAHMAGSQKEYEPSLLLPLGFGCNFGESFPIPVVIDQMVQGKVPAAGIIQWLFETGIEASEAMPILLFIGIGAMIDFGPLLSQPVLFLFGAAAQFGIFAAILIACLLGFDLKDAASIGIIGAADGPTRSLYLRCLVLTIWDRLQWQPIPIWLWFLLSSLLRSGS